MRRQILMLLNLSVPDGVNLVRVNVSRVENWGVGVYVNNIANTHLLSPAYNQFEKPIKTLNKQNVS